jgi:hypothetical protein
MEVDPENIRATALIVEFMNIMPECNVKDSSLEVKRQKETKKEREQKVNFTQHLPLPVKFSIKSCHKAIDCPTKKKEMNLTVLLDALTLC